MLVCADDDDLELVGVVHLGRQLGLELEVVTAIECDDGPFLDAIDDCERALFAIIRSPHLSAERALQLKSTFAVARHDALEIVTLRLTRSARDTLTPILQKLARVDGWAPPPDPDATTGRFRAAPILRSSARSSAAASAAVVTAGPGGAFDPIPQLDAPERLVTLSGPSNDGTARNPIVDGCWDEPLIVPPRTRLGVWLGGLCCAALVAGGLWWQWNTPPTPSAPTTPPQIQVIEAAIVPPDEDDLPAPPGSTADNSEVDSVPDKIP